MVLKQLVIALSALLLLNVLRVQAAEHINDNYCDDLQGGSDESSTAACSGITATPRYFQCKGSLYLKQKVFVSRVDDGVCDCCDGSDENLSGVQCTDNCTAMESKEKERLAAQHLVQSRGFALKEVASTTAKAELASSASAEEDLRTFGPGMDENIKKAEQSLTEHASLVAAAVEQRVEQATQAYKGAVTSMFAGKPRQLLHDLLAALVLRGREEVGELVLKQAEAGTLHVIPGEPADDTQVLLLSMETAEDTDVSLGLYAMREGVATPHTVRLYDLTTLRSLKRLKREVIDSMAEALAVQRLNDDGLYLLLSTAVMEAKTRKVLALCLLDVNFFVEGEEGDDEDMHAVVAATVQAVTTSLGRSPGQIRESIKSEPDAEKQRLEAALSEARTSKQNLQERAHKATQLLQTDFGADNWLYPLYSVCVSAYSRGYTYKVCPFKEAHQDHTLVGRYLGYDQPGGGDVGWLRFKNGQHCHASRAPREMHVRLACSDNDSPLLSNVEEVEVCVYHAVLHTFMACQQPATAAGAGAGAEVLHQEL